MYFVLKKVKMYSIIPVNTMPKKQSETKVKAEPKVDPSEKEEPGVKAD